jgi:VWFA-related protein
MIRTLIKQHFFLYIGILLLNVYGQESSVKPSGAEGFKIQVGVEEVRIDAVVLDKRGYQIPDLTADDFEIYQDGQLQKIISSTYIAEHQPLSPKPALTSPKSGKPGPLHDSRPTREEVRRTIVFLVDDIAMHPVIDVPRAQMAVQKFIELQMQQGDLVAILQTTKGNASLQAFSSDKRELLSRTRLIKWSPRGPSATIPLMLATDYCLKALQNMPGRKALIIIGAHPLLPSPLASEFTINLRNMLTIYNPLADAALRAGVVIHTLDIHGLKGPEVYDSEFGADNAVPINSEDMSSGAYHEKKANRIMMAAAIRNSETPIPLSEKTGGLFLKDFNFFVDGIGAVNEEMKGYYLLSYIPPENTFKPGSAATYHKIKIRVKKAGSIVHTREGFYGTHETINSPDKNMNPLIQAMFSPFQYNGLVLHLASGYTGDAQDEYLLRAWLHLDGRNVGTIIEKDGSRAVSLEAVATTSDISGITQNSGNTNISFPVNDQEVQWIKENGIRISVSLRVKTPGAYYVRAAVKDNASGAIGSAYQFLEIPDLKNNKLSLSSIFVLDKNEDASWIQSGLTEETHNQLNTSQKAVRRGQTFRNYQAGESIDCLAIVYNAKTEKEHKPELESQFVLFQNGAKVFTSMPEQVDIRDAKDFKRIPLRKSLKLERGIQAGDYVLQLQVRDKSAQGNVTAEQTMDFTVFSSKSSAIASSAQPEPALLFQKKTVVEMTEEELRTQYRNQLKSLEFAHNQDPLKPLLAKAGENVVSFFRNFFNTSAKERVEKSKVYLAGFSPIPSEPLNLVEDYQYLILPGKTETNWVEDRTDKNNRPINPKTSQQFMMSTGYAGYSLYLHPNHQANSYFRYLGRETRLPGAHIISFAQKIEVGDYLAGYNEENKSAPIRYLVQGFVWIDPDNFQILRMYTGLLLPDRPIRLKETRTNISYGKVVFANSQQAFWLPQEIQVEWEFPEYKYSNKHKYSDYRLFSIDSDYKINRPEERR